MVWVEFLAAAALIGLSGTILATNADRLADKTGVSSGLIGLLLLSVISSLPELGTTISVVAYVGSPDLAAGNIFGSNTFNILILAVMDLMLGSAVLYTSFRLPHDKSASLAALMTAVSLGAILPGNASFFGGGVGAGTISLLVVYIFGIYIILKDEKASHKPDESEEAVKESIAKEVAFVVMSGLAVVGSGYWLATIADEIAEITGWGESFIGYLFLAVSTSLPELVISITSLRLKAYDMALANIFGSCFFNILMFTIAEPFYDGVLLKDVGSANVYLALVSLAMIVVAGAAVNAGRKGMKSGLTKWVILGLYLLGSYVVFSPGR